MDNSVKFVIEKANPHLHSKDLECLIQELANYEKMPDGPQIKADQIKSDLEKGHCGAFVAILTDAYEQWPLDTVVGFLIYYFAYSTWEGRYLFIEDVYVKHEFRRFGIGSRLWNAATKVAYEDKLPRIEFNVLAWNEPAINFYNRLGAVDLHKTESWIRFRINRKRIEELAAERQLGASVM